MIVQIEGHLTGTITAKEVKETLSQIAPTLQGVNLRNATVEQLDALLAWHAPILARAVARLDEANRFRPSYAPAGRPTRDQGGSLAVARTCTRTHRALQYLRQERAK